MDFSKYHVDYETSKKLAPEKYEDYYRHPEKYALPPFKIAGNLYYVGDKKVCSHLIDTGDGLVLFDTGFQHTIHLLVQSIWELGFNPADIKYIIHSHGHFDHIGAAEAFRRLYGCKLCLSNVDADMFRKRPELALMHMNPNPFAELFVPDLELEDGEILMLGNTEIRCVHTPGHCPGCMTFFFDIKEKGRTYHVGYFGGIGFNTLYRGFLEEYHLDLSVRDDFIHSLKKVREEKVDIVLGNHPAQNRTIRKREEMLENPGRNPFIDSDEWIEFCDEVTEGFREFVKMGF